MNNEEIFSAGYKAGYRFATRCAMGIILAECHDKFSAPELTEIAKTLNEQLIAADTDRLDYEIEQRYERLREA